MEDSYCIFGPSLVVNVIRLQLFEGDTDNKNLIKPEHIHNTHIYTQKERDIAKSPTAFQARGIKKKRTEQKKEKRKNNYFKCDTNVSGTFNSKHK